MPNWLPTCTIQLSWDESRKVWNVLGTLRGNNGPVTGGVAHQKALTTVEINRATLRALVAAVARELESTLF